MSLWARLPASDGDRFAGLARTHGVAVAAGSLFGSGVRDRLRLSFALAPGVADRAVAALAAAWGHSRTVGTDPSTGLDLPI